MTGLRGYVASSYKKVYGADAELDCLLEVTALLSVIRLTFTERLGELCGLQQAGDRGQCAFNATAPLAGAGQPQKVSVLLGGGKDRSRCNAHTLREQPASEIATALDEGSAYDFVSRFFAPRLGIPEDPVTGSAHSTLGPYWGARLGKSVLRGFQASARGGVVAMHLKGERVRLLGQAITLLRGRLYA